MIIHNIEGSCDVKTHQLNLYRDAYSNVHERDLPSTSKTKIKNQKILLIE